MLLAFVGSLERNIAHLDLYNSLTEVHTNNTKEPPHQKKNFDLR